MDYAAIVNQMEQTISALQNRLDMIQQLESADLFDVVDGVDQAMTRKEAAAFIGRSVRQLDRLCEMNRIKKEIIDDAVRIRRSTLLRYKGIIPADEPKKSHLDKMISRYK